MRVTDIGRIGTLVAVVGAFLALICLPWSTFLDGSVSLTQMNLGPSIAHPLGTDNMGRDLVVRLSEALWQSILPIWATVLVASCLGVYLGVQLLAWRSEHALAAGLSGFLRVLATGLTGIPAVVLVFFWSVMQEEAGVQSLSLSIGVIVLLRCFLQVFELFARDSRLGYWEANLAMGEAPLRRILRYGLMGAWRGEILLSLLFHLQAAVIIEASLSYLGFGVQEPNPSFGNILASHFDQYLRGSFGVLIVAVLGLYLTSRFPRALAQLIRLAWVR